MDLVRMSLRKSGVAGEEGKTKKEDERLVVSRSDPSKPKLRRKRKAGDDAGDLRRQMLDLAEKKARIEVFALLGLSEEVEVVKKENVHSQQEKVGERGCKEFEEEVEENLLMEMQDIFNDLHDLS